MAGEYRPRHPERTVLYRVLFHHFDRFLTEYESRFEREYGYFRPIIKDVVERYLDCGNPRCGFEIYSVRFRSIMFIYHYAAMVRSSNDTVATIVRSSNWRNRASG